MCDKLLSPRYLSLFANLRSSRLAPATPRSGTALEFERFAKVRREEYLVQLWGDKSNDILRKFSSNLTSASFLLSVFGQWWLVRVDEYG